MARQPGVRYPAPLASGGVGKKGQRARLGARAAPWGYSPHSLHVESFSLCPQLSFYRALLPSELRVKKAGKVTVSDWLPPFALRGQWGNELPSRLMGIHQLWELVSCPIPYQGSQPKEIKRHPPQCHSNPFLYFPPTSGHNHHVSSLCLCLASSSVGIVSPGV